MAPFECLENTIFIQKFTKGLMRQEYYILSQMAKIA